MDRADVVVIVVEACCVVGALRMVRAGTEEMEGGIRRTRVALAERRWCMQGFVRNLAVFEE